MLYEWPVGSSSASHLQGPKFNPRLRLRSVWSILCLRGFAPNSQADRYIAILLMWEWMAPCDGLSGVNSPALHLVFTG